MSNKTPNVPKEISLEEAKNLINKDRRSFIKKVLGGAIAGTILMVIDSGAGMLPPEQIPGIREEAYDMFKRRFAFIVDINRCIGCGSCCVADKNEYNVPDPFARTWIERYIIAEDGEVFVDSPDGGINGFQPRTDIKKPIRDAFFVPKLCNMCKDPPCVQVCPVGATFQTPDGFVLIDYEQCVGCAYCVQACPYGIRYINPERHTSDKCTWCYHRVRRGLLPACVNACPTKARMFGDLNDKNSEVYKILHSPNILTVLKKEMGTNPNLYYLGARQEVM